MAIFDVPQRFSPKWVHQVSTMESTEFHAISDTWLDEDELRQPAPLWSEESGAPNAVPGEPRR